jgi:hypothetical protein
MFLIFLFVLLPGTQRNVNGIQPILRVDRWYKRYATVVNILAKYGIIRRLDEAILNSVQDFVFIARVTFYIFHW